MLNLYTVQDGALVTLPGSADNIPATTVWIDLLHPVLGEEAVIERRIGIEIPTREEMREIEPSNRLYNDHGARYMTASVLCNTDLGEPKLAAITFILAGTHLVTVRYDSPKSFALFLNHAAKPGSLEFGGEAVLAGLVDTIIDRIADILERVTDEVDGVSSRVFANAKGRSRRSDTYESILQVLGTKAELVSKARESLVSIGRMLLFLNTGLEGTKLSKNGRASLKGAVRDVESLTQHCDSLSAKITFLLDAVLGLVGIEQNNVVKIFAVLSVVFMPPTLIASIYGMNFKSMPELGWEFGYPMAVVMMVAAGVVPYLYFKWKRWL